MYKLKKKSIIKSKKNAHSNKYLIDMVSTKMVSMDFAEALCFYFIKKKLLYIIFNNNLYDNY
jgi:hypothetical protein